MKRELYVISGLAQIIKHGEKNKKTFHSSFGLNLSLFKGFEVATIFLAWITKIPSLSIMKATHLSTKRINF